MISGKRSQWLTGGRVIKAGHVATKDNIASIPNTIPAGAHADLISASPPHVTALNEAVLNVIANLVFIPALGSKGAALASIISYTVPTYLLVPFFPKARGIIMLALSSLNPVNLVQFLRRTRYSEILSIIRSTRSEKGVHE